MSTKQLLERAREVISTTKAPYAGLIMDLVINPEFDNVLFIVVYRDNVESFSDRQKDELGSWLVLVRQKVENAIALFGYQCILDGVDRVPS